MKTYGRAKSLTSIHHSRYPLNILIFDRLCLFVRSGLVIHNLEQVNRDTLRCSSSGLKVGRDLGLTRRHSTKQFVGRTILPLTQS